MYHKILLDYSFDKDTKFFALTKDYIFLVCKCIIYIKIESMSIQFGVYLQLSKVSWGIHILRVNDRPAIWENGLDISSTPNDRIDFYSRKTSQTHIYIQHHRLEENLSNIWCSTLLENNQTVILFGLFFIFTPSMDSR